MNVEALYLSDLGLLLKEAALEARESATTARGTESEAFESGKLIAYYAVISLMQQQARAFELPLNQLQLDDIDPDRDLLTR